MEATVYMNVKVKINLNALTPEEATEEVRKSISFGNPEVTMTSVIPIQPHPDDVPRVGDGSSIFEEMGGTIINPEPPARTPVTINCPICGAHATADISAHDLPVPLDDDTRWVRPVDEYTIKEGHRGEPDAG